MSYPVMFKEGLFTDLSSMTILNIDVQRNRQMKSGFSHYESTTVDLCLR